MHSMQRELPPLLYFCFFEIKIFASSWALLMPMFGKPFMLNVLNPLAALHGALLIRLLNGSAVKSEVVSVCTSFPASAGKKRLDKEQSPYRLRSVLRMIHASVGGLSNGNLSSHLHFGRDARADPLVTLTEIARPLLLF